VKQLEFERGSPARTVHEIVRERLIGFELRQRERNRRRARLSSKQRVARVAGAAGADQVALDFEATA
jgi:hypothetical protein